MKYRRYKVEVRGRLCGYRVAYSGRHRIRPRALHRWVRQKATKIIWAKHLIETSRWRREQQTDARNVKATGRHWYYRVNEAHRADVGKRFENEAEVYRIAERIHCCEDAEERLRQLYSVLGRPETFVFRVHDLWEAKDEAIWFLERYPPGSRGRVMFEILFG